MTKTILVTGGKGFIGSRVVEQLLYLGYKVIVLDDNSSPSHYSAKNQHHSNATFYKSDLCNDKAYATIDANHDTDGIIHLAAKHFIPFCNAFPEITKRDNVGGAKTIHQYATKHHIPVVFASSAAVYCNEANKSALGSHDLTLDNADIYSETKIMSEKIIASGRYPHALLRFFNVYGAFDPHDHLIPKLVRHALAGSDKIQLGSKDSVRDYVYVDDVACAMVTAMKHLLDTSQNFTTDVASGSGITVQQLVEAFFKAFLADAALDRSSPVISYETSSLKRQNEIKLLESTISSRAPLKKLRCSPTTPIREGLYLTLTAEKNLGNIILAATKSG